MYYCKLRELKPPLNFHAKNIVDKQHNKFTASPGISTIIIPRLLAYYRSCDSAFNETFNTEHKQTISCKLRELKPPLNFHAKNIVDKQHNKFTASPGISTIIIPRLLAYYRSCDSAFNETFNTAHKQTISHN